MNNYLLMIVAAVLIATAGYFGQLIKKLVERYLNTLDKKEAAMTAVRFVEEVYKAIHGPEKLQKAMEAFSDLLMEKGIPCSNKEMKYLLEAAVEEMNDQAGIKIGDIEALLPAGKYEAKKENIFVQESSGDIENTILP